MDANRSPNRGIASRASTISAGTLTVSASQWTAPRPMRSG